MKIENLHIYFLFLIVNNDLKDKTQLRKKKKSK